MKTNAFALGLVNALALLTPAAFARNETPSSNYAWELQQYQFHVVERPQAKAAMLNNGFVVSSHTNPVATLNPDPTVEAALGEYGNYAGAGITVSHGSVNGHAIEVYPYTSQGLTARNQRLQTLQSQYPGLLYPAFVENWGYHISFSYGVLSSYIHLDDAIIDNEACYASTFEGWTGARFSAGPAGLCTVYNGRENVRIFWEGLDGNRGVEYRPAGMAVQGCPNLVKSSVSEDWITLSPAVMGFSHASGDQVPMNGIDVWWEFDTAVVQVAPMSAVSADGVLTIQYAWWTNPYRLAAHVIPTEELGEGRVRALGTIPSANCPNLFLEGGRGYSVRLIHGDGPAASVSGFGIVDGRAEWKVESEHETAGYSLEGATNPDGPWTELGPMEPPGSGQRTSTVPTAGFTRFRLVEVETGGNRIVHGYAEDGTRVSVPPEDHPTAAFLQTQLDTMEDGRLQSGPPDTLRFVDDRVVFFTPSSLAPYVQQYVANYWGDWWGYDPIVVNTDLYPNDPDGFRNALKSAIRTEAQSGTMFFHLVGDANDWREFDGELMSSLWVSGWGSIRQDYFQSGYPHGGQPVRDLIPTFVIPDTLPRRQNMAWLTPYFFSDLPYADTDDDGVPNVVVTRWPVTEDWEVMALALKMQLYNDAGFTGGPYAVSFFVGDLDHDGVGDGQLALAAAQLVENALPAGQQISWLRESSVPNNGLRNTAAANLWNNALPELLVMTASWSNRSWPCNFFDQTVPSNPFHMGMIHDYANHFPLVIAGSCDGGDFPRTEDPDYGRPIGERFLVEWNKGAVGWLGPGSGTWHSGNGPIAAYTVEELFAEPARPMAESWLLAMERLWADYADQAEVIKTASAYLFLGDPLSRFNRVSNPIGVEVAESPRYALSLAQNAPNPFNPSTHIAFTTDQKGTVRLAVYDVRGAHVATLVNGELPVGFHAVDWYGKGDDGNGVASGAYFYALSCEGKTLTHKMLLLK